MTNKELIRSILNDITFKVSTDEEGKKKSSLNENRENILILFTGSKNDLKIISKNLKKVRERGYSVSLCFSKSAEMILDTKEIVRIVDAKNIYFEENKNQYTDIASSIDLAIVPILTQNTLAKVSVGIQDNLVSMLLWQLLWSGKRVLVNPSSAVNKHDIQCKSKEMVNLIKSYIEKIKDYGAEIIYDHDYLRYIDRDYNSKNEYFKNNEDRSKKDIITQKSILNLLGKTNRLEVAKGSIITDLAKDTAKEKGIEIIYL